MKKRIVVLVSILLLMSISCFAYLKSVKADNNITIGWDDYAWRDIPGDTPKAGFVFEIVNVSIANNGYGIFNTNPAYFTATDNLGSVFNCDTLATANLNEWATMTLNNGDTFSGALVFELPSGGNEVDNIYYNTTSPGQNYNVVYSSFFTTTSASTPTPTALTVTPSTPEFPTIAILAAFLGLSLFAAALLTVRKRRISNS